jgi:hypothetical protein
MPEHKHVHVPAAIWAASIILAMGLAVMAGYAGQRIADVRREGYRAGYYAGYKAGDLAGGDRVVKSMDSLGVCRLAALGCPGLAAVPTKRMEQ